jgi:hypothetical protein
MHERRRTLIEQVTVIDAQHEPAHAGSLRQRLSHTRQQVHAGARAAARRRQQRGERPQRDRRRRPRRPHPLHRTTSRAGGLRDLIRQPRLADPRRPRDDYTARCVTCEQPADEAQLILAPYQRPQHTLSVNGFVHTTHTM